MSAATLMAVSALALIYWLIDRRGHSESLDVATATLEEEGLLELGLDDGTTLIVPPGALPKGTEVEAHRLSVEAAPDTPDELGSVVALCRLGTSRPPEAPLLIQVPIP